MRVVRVCVSACVPTYIQLSPWPRLSRLCLPFREVPPVHTPHTLDLRLPRVLPLPFLSFLPLFAQACNAPRPPSSPASSAWVALMLCCRDCCALGGRARRRRPSRHQFTYPWCVTAVLVHPRVRTVASVPVACRGLVVLTRGHSKHARMATKL